MQWSHCNILQSEDNMAERQAVRLPLCKHRAGSGIWGRSVYEAVVEGEKSRVGSSCEMPLFNLSDKGKLMGILYFIPFGL